jgi:TonB family protein
MIRKLVIALFVWIVGEVSYLTLSGAPIEARLKLSLLEPIFVVVVVLAAWVPSLSRRVRISAVATIVVLLAVGGTIEWSRYDDAGAAGYLQLFALSLLLAALVVGSLLSVVWLLDKIVEKLPRAGQRHSSAVVLLLLLASGCVTVPAIVEGPEVISRPAMTYPADLRQRGVGGLVKLEATIGTDGVPRNVRVLHDDPAVPPVDPALEKLSVETLSSWRFKPAMMNGRPIERRFVTAIDWKAQS